MRTAKWGRFDQTNHPDFSRYGCLEFPASIPGDSRLHVTVMNFVRTLIVFQSEYVLLDNHEYWFNTSHFSFTDSQDPYGLLDAEIGSTVVDLEDRIFCSDWRSRYPVPIERRTLRAQQMMHASRGKIEMYACVISSTSASISHHLYAHLGENFDLSCIFRFVSCASPHICITIYLIIFGLCVALRSSGGWRSFPRRACVISPCWRSSHRRPPCGSCA
jgi:hypothetical protein